MTDVTQNVPRAGGVIMKHSCLWLEDERLCIVAHNNMCLEFLLALNYYTTVYKYIFKTKYWYTSEALFLVSRL